MNPNRHYVFDCVDAYTAGNPVRLIKSPKPDLKGITMGEKRIHFIKDFDWIRTGLMFEPHGHDMMSGSFFYPPQNSKNDIANCYGIDQEKISVVYNGVSNDFGPISSQEKLQYQQSYTKGKPYFIFVGSIHPRKNV